MSVEAALAARAADRDLVAQEQATGRWGLTSRKPAGDYTLVVAVARHVYREPERGVMERVVPGQMYWMQSHRVERNQALVAPVPERPMAWWDAPRRVIGPELCIDGTVEGEAHAAAPSAGALRIVSGCSYDPGSAAVRFHAAINEHSKHAMAFFRWADTNPHCSLRQFDALRDVPVLRHAVQEADVLHNHVAYYLLNNTGLRPRDGQLVVRHYHGSATGGRTNLEPIFDRTKDALILGARLQLVAEAASFGLPMEWSPIPVPVARYRHLRDEARGPRWVPLEGEATTARPLRIAHTPTNQRLKGTDVLRKVVSELQGRGVPVALELIHNVKLDEALRRQARCDVTFDSFWLGIQGSGLQGAAMQQPVVAGDADNRVLYEDAIGHVPYTFANDHAALAETLERLAMDPEYRVCQSDTVAEYCQRYHDYRAVSVRYEHTLARRLGRTDILTDPHSEAPWPLSA